VRKDGSHIWVDLRGTLIDARTGDSLWMSIDITERRQTDQKLRTFSRIVEQAPMSIVITDLMGTIEYANPWTSTVIGYGLEELIGQNPRVLKSGQTPPEVYADLWQTLGAGQVWRGEFLNRKKSGEVLVEQAVVAPVLADDEHITHYVALKEDITLRKQAAQALESIEWRFRRAIEEAPLPIMIHAQDGTVLSISRTWSELSGYSLQDIPSIADWTERAYGGRMQTVRKYIGTLYEKSERVHEGEYIIRCRDGSERIWDFSSVGLGTMPDGRRIVSSMALDVTQRKHQEQALQDSLNDKVALLNEVHHRVKNNLQVITSLLRLEARRSTLPETQSVLKDMQGRIHSMALLHESLYRSGIFASVDLGSYIKQIATQAFRAQASGAARLELNLASLQVNMDLATPCGLLVNELVSNCLKHAFPEGRRGEVRIELEAVPWADLPHVADAPDLAAPNYASALWRLRVSDTGVGLPADFETRRSQSLGLQLVGDLTRQLDATLEIGAGPGAQFTMTFRQPVL
jgi:PAS domain S-box-containing protein